MTIDAIFQEDVNRVLAFWFRLLMLDVALRQGTGNFEAKQKQLLGKSVSYVDQLESVVQCLVKLAPCNCVQQI